jgi:hypothetical protein
LRLSGQRGALHGAPVVVGGDGATDIALYHGDTGTAISLLAQCLDILGELEDRRGVAVACATAVMPTGWLGGSMMPGMIWPVR